MTDITKEVTGGFAAFVADRLYVAAGEPLIDDLSFVDHHHWGLTAILAGQISRRWRPYLYGAGVTLVFQEAVHDVPFNLVNEASNAVTLLLLGANMIMWGVRKP